MRTIVDHSGEEVQVPVEINKIVMTTLTPLAAVYVYLQEIAVSSLE